MASERVTLKDVAEASGMSPAAVSLVLNDRPNRISESSRERIRRSARELGYVPNRVARTLASRRSYTVGLLLPDIANPFFAQLAQSMVGRCREDGYAVIIGAGEGTGEREGRYLSDYLVPFGVDGLLLVTSTDDTGGAVAEELAPLDVPCVLVDRVPEDPPADSVCFDHELGGYLATRHLVGAGHRRIACLTRLTASRTGRLRRDGYARVLQKGRIPYDPDLVLDCRFSAEAGYAAADRVRELMGEGVTAVFSASGSATIGLVKRLGELGVSVPGDLSVVSYDKSAAEYLLPLRLTSVEQDTDLLADQAFSALCSRIDGVAGAPRHVSLTPRLVLGDSVRRLH